MSTELAIVIAGALLGAVAIVALPLISLRLALFGLVLLRSLSDIGASSTGSLLPSSLISGGLAVLAILVAVLPYREKSSTRAILVVVVLLFGTLFSTIIAAIHFGVDTSMIQESVRLVSLVAVLVAAVKVGKSHGDAIPGLLASITIPPSIILIVGYFLGATPTMNKVGRAVGTFSHANSAAAFMSIAAIVMLGIWWFSRSRITLIAGLLALVSLFLTQSLGGILGFAMAAVTMIIISSGISAARKVMFLIVAGAAAVVLFTVSGAADRLDEFEGAGVGNALQSGVSTDSLGWRFINWALLLEEWSKQPWFGYGLGTTGSKIMPLGAPPHSVPVQLLVEIGAVGAALLAVLGIWGMLILNRQRKRGLWEATVVIGGAVFVIVNGSESNLLGYTSAAYLLALSTGLLWGKMARAPRLIDVGPPSYLIRDAARQTSERTLTVNE